MEYPVDIHRVYEECMHEPPTPEQANLFAVIQKLLDGAYQDGVNYAISHALVPCHTSHNATLRAETSG